MMRIAALLLLLALLGLPAACARDVTGGLEEDPYPTSVTMAFRVRGQIDPAVWYYMVFNFTAAPSTVAASAPLDFISNEDRGRNWELYVALHRDAQGVDQLLTLQRPSLPTVLPTDLGPADAAAADFTGDNRADIAVACRLGDHVQLIRSRQVDILDPIYYDDPVFISAGPKPVRLFPGEFTGDTNTDLLVLFAGNAAGDGFLRVLAGDGTGNFTAGTDLAVPATIVDGLMGDFNGDGELDLLLLTGGATAGDRVMTVYTGDGAGNFTAGASYPAGSDPRMLATGQLDAGAPDVVIADYGSGGQDGSARTYLGAGDGTFTAGPVLAVQGDVTSAAIGVMYGNSSVGDIVVSYTDAAGAGHVGVFMNEPDTDIGTTLTATGVDGTPAWVLALDTSGDGNGDALLVNGAPGSGGTSLIIQRGEREDAVNPGDPRTFIWDPEPINYVTGLEPSLIRVVDLDSDGQVDDLLIPNSADDPNGNSVNLFFALGKDNFTSADIYWTDDTPGLLTQQEWYISHTVGPNFFELTLDPGLFYDLARRPPSRDSGSNVTFMTGSTGIDLVNNPDQLGLIRDVLQHPVNVPMEVGHYNDEQNTPLAQDPVPVASEDIDNWRVEVF